MTLRRFIRKASQVKRTSLSVVRSVRVPADAVLGNLSQTSMLSYAMPMVACCFLLGPTYSVVPALYAKYFGLELAMVAAAVLCTRLVDTICDPLIGYLSDGHRRRGGSRKMWLVAGGIAMSVCAVFLFSPPPQASFAYYIVWSFAFSISYSLIEIPHVAWGGELGSEQTVRSAIFSCRSAAIFCGFVLWAAFPLMPFFGDQEFTPPVLQNIACAGVVLFAATITWAAVRAPECVYSGRARAVPRSNAVHSVVSNRPLLLLLSAYFFCVLGFGMWQGLVFIYFDSHLGIGRKFAMIQLLANVAALLVIPGWRHLARKFHTSTVWMIGLAVFVMGNTGFLLLEPGASWWQALALSMLIHTSFSCLYMVVPALLSDVVDYGEFKFKQNRGGVYFALNTLVAKGGLGVGAAFAFAIAASSGVDVSQASQTHQALSGLQLAFIYLPIVFLGVSAVFIVLTPINRRRHSALRRRIEARARRVAKSAAAALQ